MIKEKSNLIFIAEIGLNHLGNDRLAISMVKSCLTANLEGITLQIQPHDYYNNKKNFRRKLKKSTYKKIYTIVKKKKIIRPSPNG